MTKRNTYILSILVMTALALGTATSRVQFQVQVTVTNGVTQQLYVGVSGDGAGGMQDNTIGADTDTSYGAYREELAPPAPPAPFPLDARLMTIPGRVSTFPAGLGSGVYSDFRGWDSYLQVDTFKITIDGDNVDANTTTISWPSGLNAYGSAWVIQPQSGGEWAPVDMIANTNVVIPAAVLQRSILIIKTGAGPAGPVFALNPNNLNFGVVSVGSMSTIQSVFVTNPSTTNALNVNVTADADYLVVPMNANIPAGASQSFDVRFIPTAPGPGGNLEFTHDAPGSPDTLYVTSVGQDTSKYLTLSPDTLAAKDPIKGKFFKSVKRGKGLKPNWANLIEETVVQGGFQANATESDAAGGMVIGISHMENVGGKFKPIKDSAAIRGWVRNTKWDPIKGGKGYSDLQKTMEDKTGSHLGLGTVRGFDVLANLKPFVKQQKKITPKKQANTLYAELVALKFNIAASQLGKTPPGFGELVFDTDGNICDELAVKDIAAEADTMLTYWGGVSQADFDSLYAAVYRINRAFLSALDTLTFEVGAKLTAKGVLNATTYLKPPAGPVPIARLDPTTERTEEDPTFFDGDDFEGDSDVMPVAAQLDQNYPNPFNPTTTIGFRLRSVSTVSVSVFNMLGQVVATLAQNEEFDEGYQTVDFVGNQLSSGVYFYRMEVREIEGAGAVSVETRKMTLLK